MKMILNSLQFQALKVKYLNALKVSILVCICMPVFGTHAIADKFDCAHIVDDEILKTKLLSAARASNVVAVIRHTDAPSIQSNPANPACKEYRRVLSDPLGKSQAELIKADVQRVLGLNFSILASKACRTIETAEIIVGRRLNNNEKSIGLYKSADCKSIIDSEIEGATSSDTNAVVVTHSYCIKKLFDPIRSLSNKDLGVAVLYDGSTDIGSDLKTPIGCVWPGEWSLLEVIKP